MYDYLIVGAGLFGATFAYAMSKKRKKCLVIDKRNHIAGNVYTFEQDGITVHKYGAHIFHTGDDKIAGFMKEFSAFNRFTNSPLANYEGKLYNLPFNMNTFYAIWGVKTPEAARNILNAECAPYRKKEAKNLEDYALSLVGPTIYNMFIKGYTEKQWGRPPKDLPASIIKRIPLRFTFDNNYYFDNFQGIPVEGYTTIIDRMLSCSEVQLQVPFTYNLQKIAHTTIYTGPIDEYYNYQDGPLEYRGLVFKTETLTVPDYQGNAVVNYTSISPPFTRIIEHKHFMFGTQPKTIITKEYPHTWTVGEEPYYPVNDEKNNSLYKKYASIPNKNILFAGRLGSYRYYDMQDTIKAALTLASSFT